MSRDKNYQRLLNSKRWKQLRQWKLQQNPLCERCQEHDIVSASVDIHHKIPVETAHTIQEMESLCFNPANLQALCIPCHIAAHKEEKSHTKQAHQQRTDDRLARWIAKHTQKYGLSNTERETSVDTTTKD